MAHQVETMAYTNRVPWHGLGTYVENAPTVKEIIRLAGLNWTVEKRPLIAATTKAGDHYSIQVPDKFALVRSKDKAVLNVVGKAYMPIQNKEAFEFFTEFVQAGNATMETAGSLQEGKYVWGLANLNESFTVGNKKDKVKGYLLVMVPHGQGSLIIRLTPVRVVCNNTLTLALRDVHAPEFRMAHRSAFGSDRIAQAKETLGIAREQLAEFKENALALKKKTMTVTEVTDFCLTLMQPQLEKAARKNIVTNFEELASPTIKRIMDCYSEAPGADVGTAWGALNAVTYYADHVASPDNTDGRLHSAWLGKLAKKKERGLKLLLAS